MNLDEFVRQCEKAWQVFVTGTPIRRCACSLVATMSPSPIRGVRRWGWARVSITLEEAARRFRNGQVTAFNILSKFVSDDLACYHEIEHGAAMLGGRSELEPFTLRVTSVYRREDGPWRILLRHADPIMAARPAEETLSR